jgi:uncharacterized membrane protein YjjB (DUF3815 family)
MVCGHQFRGKVYLERSVVWEAYTEEKQTIYDLSLRYKVSESTIKRLLKDVSVDWKNPKTVGHGVVNLDATYFGRNCGVIAALSYLLYWVLAFLGISDALAVFAGALFGSLSGQWFARRMKMIGTVFLMSSIVPVVPGLGLYRTMALLGQGATAAGAGQGIDAMITIAMISLGLGVGSYLNRLFHAKKR